MNKSQAIRSSTSLGQIVIYLLSTAATASISAIYAPVSFIHCYPTYGDGLLSTGGPDNWVNIDMEYSIIVINVSRV